MKVGRAICNVLDGITITVSGKGDITVLNNMGNQDALNKFIAESDKRKQAKYPLVFYVIAPVKTVGNYSYTETDLIIMMNTHEPWLYKNRYDMMYKKYIEPVYDEVVKKLKQNLYVSVLGDKMDRFAFVDVPNYGIRVEKPAGKSQEQSTVTDYVDARIVKLKLKVNTNCLIT